MLARCSFLSLVLIGCGTLDDPGNAPATSATTGSAPATAGSTGGGEGGASTESTSGPGGRGEAGSGGSGPGAGGAGGAACPSGMDDEFDDACTLSQWTSFPPEQYTLLDVDSTTAGHLTIVPTQSGWYADGTGPFLYKDLAGDFVMMTRVTAGRVGAPDLPPTQDYNSAGMLVRDPNSPSPAQNWLMYNVGFQAGFVATEGKTTVDSQSTLYLTPGARQGVLALCRLGDTFHMLRRLEGESAWTETDTFVRPDLPATLQVGLIVNGWEGPPDLFAMFDWVRFAVPTSVAECTSLFAP